MLLHAMLVGLAVEMELRGYMKEEVSGMEVLQSWWGSLINRKLDSPKLDSARGRALDPLRLDDAVLGEGNFFEKALAVKFSKQMSEFVRYDDLVAENIERPRLVMVEAFDIGKKHSDFEVRDGKRKRRVDSVLAKERRWRK